MNLTQSSQHYSGIDTHCFNLGIYLERFSSMIHLWQKSVMEPFKFEKLEVWNASLSYHELIYEVCYALPKTEQYNLEDQLKRAATSICLNIAEGSTGQSNSEQKRFLSYAIRSSIETIAILRLIQRHYPRIEKEKIELCNMQCHMLLRKLQAFRNYLKKK